MTGAGTCCKDDRLTCHHITIIEDDLTSGSTPLTQPCRCHDHRNVVFFHQVTDAAGKPACDITRPLDHLAEIKTHITNRQPEITSIADQMVYFCCSQQCLCRYTAPVQADSAHIFAFNNSNGKTKLAGTDRSDIAARAATNDNNIKSLVSHQIPLRPVPAQGFQQAL